MYNQILKVTPVASTQCLSTILPLWSVSRSGDSSALTRTVVCRSFEDTWAFLTQVSMRAHRLGHHPTLTTTYTKVEFRLTTHDLAKAGQEGVISDVDVKLAKQIDLFAGRFV